MEITRGPGYFGPGQVRVWHDEWDMKEGELKERTYLPDFPEHAALAKETGHGGGDFWTNHFFEQAIRTGTQPFLDVYRSVAMSSVGILAWKSALCDGAPFDMPDFKNEYDRKKYENDDWSPFPKHKKPGQPEASILGNRKPDKEAVLYTHKIWESEGYRK
jgi:hypothetical protein